MTYLADQVHALGLGFGLYTDRGTETCGGRPGIEGYEVLDADTYADWGVDYLKVGQQRPRIGGWRRAGGRSRSDGGASRRLPSQVDSCNAPGDHTAAYTEYAKVRDALNQTGRPIFYSLCGCVRGRARGVGCERSLMPPPSAFQLGDVVRRRRPCARQLVAHRPRRHELAGNPLGHRRHGRALDVCGEGRPPLLLPPLSRSRLCPLLLLSCGRYALLRRAPAAGTTRASSSALTRPARTRSRSCSRARSSACGRCVAGGCRVPSSRASTLFAPPPADPCRAHAAEPERHQHVGRFADGGGCCSRPPR